MEKRFDCAFCGEICIDLPIRPLDRNRPLAKVDLVKIAAIEVGCGGIVPNSGIAMAKMGLRGAAFGCVGDDVWGHIARQMLEAAGMDVDHVVTCGGPSSATAVLGGADGEHTFAYHSGASHAFDLPLIEKHFDLFADSAFALFGYYALMPNLEHDLPEVLKRVRQTGCKTALDAAAGGGTMQPLDEILPHLDVYVPSYSEARQQTSQADPHDMITEFRKHGAQGLLGVKLGSRGALLQTADGAWMEIAPVEPPAEIVDTTGAGDCFFAGLIAGLVRGHPAEEAGRLGAAAGACSVTGVGAVRAMVHYDELVRMAGLEA